MSAVSTIVEGRRIYLSGNTYPIKDKIKSLGAHWDGERKMWWIGSQAKAEVEALISTAPKSEAYTPTPITRDSRVYRKVKYTGKSGATRTYYVVAESKSGKYRLTTLDLSIDFWADAVACETVKVYQPRENRGRYGRQLPEQYRWDYTTIGSIADFIAESRKAEKQIESGEIPDGYDRDLEDGVVKRISECDMPANH